MRDPTRTGGGVCHSTLLMLTYHLGTLSGSEAKSETSAIGRPIVTFVDTSTSIGVAYFLSFLDRPARTSHAASAAIFCSARHPPSTSRPSAVIAARSDDSERARAVAPKPYRSRSRQIAHGTPLRSAAFSTTRRNNWPSSA